MSDCNIVELRDILKWKVSEFLLDVEDLLAETFYELVPAVDYAKKLICDAKEQLILNMAIVPDVHIKKSVNRKGCKCGIISNFIFERERK